MSVAIKKEQQIAELTDSTFDFKLSSMGKLLSFLLFSFFGLMLLVAILNASYGLDDVNIIYAFGTDEGNAVKRVQQNIANGDFDPRGHYNYGYVYESLSILLLSFVKHFDYNIDSRMVGFSLRLVSLISFLLSFLLLSKILEHCKIHRPASILIALLFVLTPSFYYWGQAIHPDVLQASILLAAAFIVVHSHNFNNALIASAFAGLGFGTKYAALFILPFLFIPHAVVVFQNREFSFRQFGELFLKGFLMIAVFCMVFAAVNPHAVENLSAAWSDFTFEMEHVKTGHDKVEAASPLLWLPVLEKQIGQALIYLLGLGCIAGFCLSCSDLIKLMRAKVFLNGEQRNRLFLVLYAVVSAVYILMFIRMREPRFTFHVLPFVFIAAFLGWNDFFSRFKLNFFKRVLVLLLLILVPIRASDTFAAMRWISHKPNSPMYEQLRFLQGNYPKRIRILSNPYAFISSDYKNVLYKYEIDYESIKEFEPEILIFTKASIGRWIWMRDGTKFVDSDFLESPDLEKTKANSSFFRSLAATNEWLPVYESADVLILAKAEDP